MHNYVKFFKENQANHKYDIGFCNTNKKIKRKAFGYPPLSDNFFDRKHMLKRLQKIQKNNGNFELGSKNPLSISVKEIPKNIRNEIIFEEQGSTYASVLHLSKVKNMSQTGMVHPQYMIDYPMHIEYIHKRLDEIRSGAYKPDRTAWYDPTKTLKDHDKAASRLLTILLGTLQTYAEGMALLDKTSAARADLKE